MTLAATDHGGRLPRVRVVRCVEHAPVEVPLDDILDAHGRLRLHPDIEKGDYFAVALRNATLTLRARGYVGCIPLTHDTIVVVRPRVPNRNFTRMARIAGTPLTALSVLREYAADPHWSPSLTDLYAAALIPRLEAIFDQGPLRAYERREGVSSFPHGRVLLHRTLQTMAPRDIHHAVHATWFERTVDTPANRCLKYAVWALARQYAADPSRGKDARRRHRRLTTLAAMFDGVPLDHAASFLRDPIVRGEEPPPAVRAEYAEALRLAVAVVERRALRVEQESGSLRLPSLIVDMNALFEDYVRALLRQAQLGGWTCRVADGIREAPLPLYDDGTKPKATPDVVLLRDDGTAALVLEVKNVPTADHPAREAVNQAVVYALRYRTGRVVLVQPRGSANEPTGVRTLGQINGINVLQYRLDLSAPDMEAEERMFTDAVAELAAGAGA